VRRSATIKRLDSGGNGAERDAATGRSLRLNVQLLREKGDLKEGGQSVSGGGLYIEVSKQVFVVTDEVTPSVGRLGSKEARRIVGNHLGTSGQLSLRRTKPTTR